jgi:hypothetical protein
MKYFRLSALVILFFLIISSGCGFIPGNSIRYESFSGLIPHYNNFVRSNFTLSEIDAVSGPTYPDTAEISKSTEYRGTPAEFTVYLEMTICMTNDGSGGFGGPDDNPATVMIKSPKITVIR